ncbi:MAG TPA: tetratricopeptide repeat protein [Terriglobales bacterium]|nr:tetratricopeptide repeat protein [Terriglobales bacterium]
MKSQLLTHLRTFAALTVAVLMFTVLTQAQSESGVDAGTNFTGEVRYENNAPAQFVQVELWTDGEASWRTFATTDRSGKFHAGAPCMVIQYKVDVPNYSPVWGRVDMSMQPCHALEWITLKSIKKSGEGQTPAAGLVDSRIAAIPPEAKTEFEAGQLNVNSNDYSDAISHLQKAIDLYPRYAEAYQLLGVAHLQLNHGPQAEASLVKAIDIEDRMPKAQYLLGVLYAMTNRANLAERPLIRFAELDPQNPDAQLELAKVYFALSKFPESELHARMAIKLKESKPGVYIVLGYAQLRQKKAEEARRAFQQFLRIDPNGPMAVDMKNLVAQIDQRTGK